MIDEGLRERIAEALGWTVEETKSVSLPSLREVLRGTGNEKLIDALNTEIRSGRNIIGVKSIPGVTKRVRR